MKLSEQIEEGHTIYILTAETKEEQDTLKKFQNINDETVLQCFSQNDIVKIWFCESNKESIGSKIIEI